MLLGLKEDGTIYMMGDDWMSWPIYEVDWREQYSYIMREVGAHLDFINRRNALQQKQIAALKEEKESLLDRLYEIEP